MQDASGENVLHGAQHTENKFDARTSRNEIKQTFRLSYLLPGNFLCSNSLFVPMSLCQLNGK